MMGEELRYGLQIMSPYQEKVESIPGPLSVSSLSFRVIHDFQDKTAGSLATLDDSILCRCRYYLFHFCLDVVLDIFDSMVVAFIAQSISSFYLMHITLVTEHQRSIFSIFCHFSNIYWL